MTFAAPKATANAAASTAFQRGLQQFATSRMLPLLVFVVCLGITAILYAGTANNEANKRTDLVKVSLRD